MLAAAHSEEVITGTLPVRVAHALATDPTLGSGQAIPYLTQYCQCAAVQYVKCVSGAHKT